MLKNNGILKDVSVLRLVIKLQLIVIGVLLGGGLKFYLDIREFNVAIRRDVDAIAVTQAEVIDALTGNPSRYNFNRFTSEDATETFGAIMIRLDRIERQHSEASERPR